MKNWNELTKKVVLFSLNLWKTKNKLTKLIKDNKRANKIILELKININSSASKKKWKKQKNNKKLFKL